MSTVKALALIRGELLISVHVIFQNGEKTELPVTPQKWEKRKLMAEFIRRLLKQNNMKVNSYGFMKGHIYNIYYIDVENFTVERRLS